MIVLATPECIRVRIRRFCLYDLPARDSSLVYAFASTSKRPRTPSIFAVDAMSQFGVLALLGAASHQLVNASRVTLGNKIDAAPNRASLGHLRPRGIQKSLFGSMAAKPSVRLVRFEATTLAGPSVNKMHRARLPTLSRLWRALSVGGCDINTYHCFATNGCISIGRGDALLEGNVKGSRSPQGLPFPHSPGKGRKRKFGPG